MMNNFLQSIHRTLRFRAFRWWVLACIVAVPLGTVLHQLLNQTLALLYFSDYFIPGIETIYDYYSYSGGHLAMQSMVLAFCQWLVLRRYFHRASGWLVATAVGSAIATLIYAVSSYGLMHGFHTFSGLAELPVVKNVPYVLPSVLSLGFGIGIAQWWFLRGQFDSQVVGAERWIVVVLVAQLAIAAIGIGSSLHLSAPLFDLVSTRPVAISHPIHLINGLKFLLAGLLSGLVQGTLTGWMLTSFIAQQKRESIAIF